MIPLFFIKFQADCKQDRAGSQLNVTYENTDQHTRKGYILYNILIAPPSWWSKCYSYETLFSLKCIMEIKLLKK